MQRIGFANCMVQALLLTADFMALIDYDRLHGRSRLFPTGNGRA